MQFIDWILVGGSLLLVLGMGLYTQRYVQSIADFLSAGRVARRYLLAVSSGEMGAGAVVFVAAFEVAGQAGFTNAWWGWMVAPVFLVLTIFGFVTYRYRETRALTLGQFFEIRYSRKFRLFAGLLGFFAGIINFGIVPAVGARFMVYFLGLPGEIHAAGMVIPTYVPLMGLFLGINLLITLSGGLITIMMTNCFEGIVSQLFYLVLIVGLLTTFRWTEITHVLGDRPPGHSMLNPFDSMGIKDFNIWYVIMGLLTSIYGRMAWQNQSAYQSAPLSAHEGRMGALLGGWRETGKAGVVALLSICAVTYLHHPDFAAGAARVQGEVAKIANPQIQEQMQIPIAITQMLPPGLKGALCAVLLLGIIGGDSNHLHSWGSIFIQDVVLPFRRRAFTPRQHLLLLRLSMAGVAFFAFLFGTFFHQTEYIQMWWNITQGIFVGGAGCAIIGGLYWKKGTTAGAWTGMLIGSGLSFAGILARQIYQSAFPLNGLQIAFVAALAAITGYVTVSLLTRREDFNLERMLHRGRYAVVREELGDTLEPDAHRRLNWGKIIGYDSNFSWKDKWVAGGLFAWTMTFFFIMLAGSAWNLIAPWPVAVWSQFWHVAAIAVPVVIAFVTGIWFTCGSLADIAALFRQLRQERVNPLDNGAVAGHRNLDEKALPDPAPSAAPVRPASPAPASLRSPE